MTKQFSILPFALFGMLLTALGPTLKAVTPPPDGGYANGNTAEGEDALFSLTTGTDQTAVGYHALHNLSGYTFTTAVGALSMANITTNYYLSISVGFQTLSTMSTGLNVAAIGYNALPNVPYGYSTCAVGTNALSADTGGGQDVAVGSGAMQNGTQVDRDIAFGYNAYRDGNGDENVVVGSGAFASGTGSDNVAIGSGALGNLTGEHSNNIAVGYAAGSQLGSSGDDNIDIGNVGAPGDSGVIRIGTIGMQTNAFIAGIVGVTGPNATAVVIDTNGHLGTMTSSARYKENVKPMENASEVLYSLQPVAFRYRPELDPSHRSQFGLVAEDVAKVAPSLVARDQQGRPYAIRYQAVDAMLLNEFQKDHRAVTQEEATLTAHAKQLDNLAEKAANLELELAEQAKEVNNFGR